MIGLECDYLLMPIIGSGWVYLCVDYWNGVKCLVYKKDILK